MNKSIRPAYMVIAGVLLIATSDAIDKTTQSDALVALAGFVDLLGILLLLFGIAGAIVGAVKRRRHHAEKGEA